MTLNKKVLAGLVALAAASTSAQAVTLVAEDGWEVKVGGMINQFVTFSDNGNGGDDVNEVRDGLLPAFLNFDFKAPTMNGLDIAAHISISPSTNTDSYGATTPVGGSGLEQREVYFTVDGSFGQILAGKALGLYGSHNILTDQTLWGVGYGTGSNLQTTLGGIGLGYDYAAWRSQVRWTSNDMNGFKIALSVNDNAGSATSLSGKPTGSVLTGARDSEDFRYEGDLSYAGTFDSGSFSAWLSAMHQGDDVANGVDASDDEQAWTVGGTLVYGGFEAMAQYSDSEGSLFGAVDSEWNQFIVQAGYRFAGTTLVSVNYSELEDDSSNAVRTALYGNPSDDTIDKVTVGVYHDVNANLKLVAEYTSVEDDVNTGLDQDIYSLGGFVFF